MSISALRLFTSSIAAIIHLTIFIISIRARKNVKPALPFTYLVFWASVSAGGTIAGQLLTPQVRSSSLVWFEISFIGLLLAAPALVLFILNQLRSNLGSNKIFILLLHLPPLAMVPFVVTNRFHHLIWNPAAGLFRPGFFNPLYTLGMLAAAAYAVAALGLLFAQLFKTERIYQKQYGLFLIGIIVPILIFAYTHYFDLALSIRLNLTTLGWSLMLIPSAFALLRLPMYGLLPITQNELLRHIRDGFLITNPFQEIIFINPAAQKALQITDKQAIGKPLSSLISARTKKIIVNTEMKHTSFELQVDSNHYHVNISNIRNRQNYIIGQIVMIYDVTAQTEFANQFREQANKDDLTNVFNRRYLLELARIEFERSVRYHLPLSIIIIDLDNLKRINDHYGHITGDDAIQALSAACESAIRGSDTIGRLGGDEFMVLLPHTAAPEAVSIVNRLAVKLERTLIDTDEGQLRLSASFGITSLNEITDTDLEDLIKRADRALYRAKSDPKSSSAEIHSSTI